MLGFLLIIFKYWNIFILFKIICKILRNFIPYFIGSNKKEKFLETYGKNSYVLITGSSEGIGFSYAEYFAKLGFNIILTGRKEEKWKKSKEDILSKLKNKVEIIYHVIDFNSFTDNLNEYKRFINKLEGLDISILINNVGFSYKNNFEKYDYKELMYISNLNCIPMTYLIHDFIKNFSSRFNKSAIITISSTSAIHKFAYSGVYSSTKLFNKYISESINKSKNDNKIDMLAVLPGFVDTNLIKGYFTRKLNHIQKYTSNAEEVASGSLNNLGIISTCFGSINHIFTIVILDTLFIYFGLFNLEKYIHKKLSTLLETY